MNSSQKNARLKRVPVWPMWGALIAALCLPFASDHVNPLGGFVVAQILVAGRRPLLTSIARVYSFKRIRSRRVRNFVWASPFIIGLSWCAMLCGFGGWRVLKGYQFESENHLWFFWVSCMVIAFMLIHFDNLRRLDQASKEARRICETPSHP